MTLEVSDHDLGPLSLSVAEAKLDFAIGLYTGRHLSMGKASRIAGLSSPAFLQELGRRGLAVTYSQEDFAHDLRIIDGAPQK
jgi:predicted HTH domain antitoxin